MINSKQILFIVMILTTFIAIYFPSISYANAPVTNVVTRDPVSIDEENDAVKIKDFIETDTAKIIILNKITAKPVTEIFKLNEAKTFGNLSIILKKCVQNTDPFNLDNSMLISIDDTRFENENLFYGWVFSSNPSISTFEHPVFEIIPIECIKQ